MKRKLFVFFILALLVFQVTVSAQEPYQSYNYDGTNKAVKAPDAFSFSKSIDLASILDSSGKTVDKGRLNEPSNIYMDAADNIYISDTGNARIVVLNKDYSFNRIIDGYTDAQGAKQAFLKPQGVFVDNKKILYVCDEDANQIVCLNPNGTLNRLIKEGVASPLLNTKVNGEDQAFIFMPMKVAVDKTGRTFVIAKNFNKGLIELDKHGEFVQCLGAPKVSYDLVELLWRQFSTEAQRNAMVDFVPTEYNNVAIDPDGFLYVTTSIFDETTAATTDFVKKLNAKGKDVLAKSALFKPYGDSTAPWRGTYSGPSRLNDVMILENGVYAVMDSLRSKVFFYNAEGVQMFEFGAPPDMADSTHRVYADGFIDKAAGIEQNGNDCLVLDSGTKTLKVFSLTAYGEKILEATALQYKDKYTEAEAVWRDVLALNNNSYAAQQNLGKVAYRNGDYDTAMQYFKETYDADNYSKTFKLARRDAISENFNMFVLILVIVIIVLVVLSKLFKKRIPPIKEHSYLGHLKYAGRVIFRPLNGYWSLTREGHSSVASAVTILAAASVMSLLQARFTGFIFDMHAEKVNVFLELLSIVLPLLLFCICNWCISSLMGGEGNFKRIFISSAYALTPMIILYPFAILLSNIMAKEEGDFYTVFVMIALLWVLLLLVCGNMRTHDYSMGKTLGVLLLTVLVMLLVVFLFVLFFALIQQMTEFVKSIATELSMRS